MHFITVHAILTKSGRYFFGDIVISLVYLDRQLKVCWNVLNSFFLEMRPKGAEITRNLYSVTFLNIIFFSYIAFWMPFNDLSQRVQPVIFIFYKK